jgi:DNA mismatch repair protein MSH3
MGPTPKSTEKKQISLTSFFQPKTVNGLAVAFQKSQKQAAAVNPSPDSIEDHELSSPAPRKRPLEEDASKVNNGPKKASKRVKGGNTKKKPTIVSPVSSPPPAADIAAPTKPSAHGTSRTSKYIYDGSSAPDAMVVDCEEEDDDPETRRRKEELHRDFVKRLGHPDSMAMIRGRNRSGEDGANGADDDEDGGDGPDEADSPPPAKSKGKAAAKGGAKKLTPLEIQVLDIKRKNMDTILIVEVGYKFRFFGEDARIAAKELSIVCIPGKMRYDEREYIPCL